MATNVARNVPGGRVTLKELLAARCTHIQATRMPIVSHGRGHIELRRAQTRTAHRASKRANSGCSGREARPRLSASPIHAPAMHHD
jgi:hypothetical protein